MGIELPRTSGEQARVGNTVNGNSFRPGDLAFFDEPDGRITHVAHANAIKGRVTK